MRLLTVLLFVAVAFAGDRNLFFHYRVTVGANETITVQSNVANKEVAFKGALFTASAACTASLELNGAAATATAATTRRLNTKASDQADVKVYVASDAGAGQVVHVYDVPASSTWGLSPLFEDEGLTILGVQNFSLRTTCPIGTKITVFYAVR